MSATASVKEANGAGPDWNTVTAARFCSADSYNPGTSYPIPVPDSGTNYSYWKTWRLSFSGTWTEITNVKFYTDGSNGYGTGIGVQIGDETLAAGSYDQSTGVEGTGGDVITDHSGITGSTDIFGYTSGNQKTVDTGTLTTGGTTVSKFIVVQASVDSTASAGVTSAETLSFVYDEI